jgi:hypothetical protein
MAEIISCDSAHVHAHQTLHFGLEHLLLLAHRVVQPQLRRRRRRWNRRLRGAQRTETSTADKAALLGLGLEEEDVRVVGCESNRPYRVGESDWGEGSVELEKRSHFGCFGGSALRFAVVLGLSFWYP